MVSRHPPDRRIVTIVTAGHVDHGKSALVEALTGQHPDRLPEERQRSMTIALGFAATDLPDGTTLSLIDVPGHERLIEVMIAGAGGVDAALLVVAADDGPMPQTDEHLDVLRLLGVPRVIVAVSRVDLVAPDGVDRVVASVGDHLADRGWPGAPIIATSARTGHGIADLRAELGRIDARTHGWGIDDATWLPIDRSFTLRGAGTVVTGTLQRGTLSVGQRVHLESGTSAVVRGLQRHGSPVLVAGAGHRVAVNLASLAGPIPVRGETLSDRPVPSTRSVIAGLDLLDGTAAIPPDEMVRVLGGAWRRNARLRPVRSTGETTTGVRLVRVRFERPVAVAPGERLIARRPAPSAILGGAVVLDRAPPRRLSPEDVAALSALAGGDPAPSILARTGRTPARAGDVLADLPADARPALDTLVDFGTIMNLSSDDDASASRPRDGDCDWLIRTKALHGLVDRLTEALERRTASHPHLPEVSTAGLGPVLDIPQDRIDPILDWAERRVHVLRSGPAIRLPGARPVIPTAQEPTVAALMRSAASASGWLVRPPDELDPATLAVLEFEARGVTMPDGRLVPGERFDGFVTWLLAPAAPIGLRAVADGLGVGRDAAQQLLESTDRLGLTVRVGNHRVPGPEAAHWRRRRIARRRRRLGIELLGVVAAVRADPFGGVADIVVIGDDGTARLIGIAVGRGVTVVPVTELTSDAVERMAAAPGGSSPPSVILCPLGHASDDATTAAREAGVGLRRRGIPVLFYDDPPDRPALRNGHPADAVGALAERGIGLPGAVIVRSPPSIETASDAMILPDAPAAGAVTGPDVADGSGTARRRWVAGRRWAGIADGALRLWTLSDP